MAIADWDEFRASAGTPTSGSSTSKCAGTTAQERVVIGVGGMVHVDVAFDQGMALGAMRARRTHLNSPQQIFLHGDGFEMEWIHTSPVPANVVDVQSVRDGTDEVFVSEPMSEDPKAATRIAASVEGAVSRFADGTFPQPTVAEVVLGSEVKPVGASGINLHQESDEQWCAMFRSHRRPHTLTVQGPGVGSSPGSPIFTMGG